MNCVKEDIEWKAVEMKMIKQNGSKGHTAPTVMGQSWDQSERILTMWLRRRNT